MNSLRSSLAALAACGLLFSATVSAVAAPKDYQITGTVSVLTDTNVTLITLQKQNWDFARDTTTKAPDGLKIGDKVTVHYTMTAGNIEAKPTADAKKAATPAKTTKKTKPDAPAKTDATASGSPSKPAAEAPSPTP